MVSSFLRRLAARERQTNATESASARCTDLMRRCSASWSRNLKEPHSISSRRRGRERSQSEREELTAMDYSLPAVKMHIGQLKPAKPAKELRSNGGVAFTLGSLVFQRAWLQGVLVQGLDKASLALQDETGVLPIHLAAGDPGTIGAYVLLVGQYVVGPDGSPFLLVHKIVDLTSSPHRDEFWRLEVAEAHKLFYDKLINSPTR